MIVGNVVQKLRSIWPVFKAKSLAGCLATSTWTPLRQAKLAPTGGKTAYFRINNLLVCGKRMEVMREREIEMERRTGKVTSELRCDS